MDLTSAVPILAVIALILSVVGICRPSWPVTSVAVLLVCVALLVMTYKK